MDRSHIYLTELKPGEVVVILKNGQVVNRDQIANPDSYYGGILVTQSNIQDIVKVSHFLANVKHVNDVFERVKTFYDVDPSLGQNMTFSVHQYLVDVTKTLINIHHPDSVKMSTESGVFFHNYEKVWVGKDSLCIRLGNGHFFIITSDGSPCIFNLNDDILHFDGNEWLESGKAFSSFEQTVEFLKLGSQGPVPYAFSKNFFYVFGSDPYRIPMNVYKIARAQYRSDEHFLMYLGGMGFRDSERLDITENFDSVISSGGQSVHFNTSKKVMELGAHINQPANSPSASPINGAFALPNTSPVSAIDMQYSIGNIQLPGTRDALRMTGAAGSPGSSPRDLPLPGSSPSAALYGPPSLGGSPRNLPLPGSSPLGGSPYGSPVNGGSPLGTPNTEDLRRVELQVDAYLKSRRSGRGSIRSKSPDFYGSQVTSRVESPQNSGRPLFRNPGSPGEQYVVLPRSLPSSSPSSSPKIRMSSPLGSPKSPSLPGSLGGLPSPRSAMGAMGAGDPSEANTQFLNLTAAFGLDVGTYSPSSGRVATLLPGGVPHGAYRLSRDGPLMSRIHGDINAKLNNVFITRFGNEAGNAIAWLQAIGVEHDDAVKRIMEVRGVI